MELSVNVLFNWEIHNTFYGKMDRDIRAKIERIEEVCQLLKGEDAPVTSWFKNLTEAVRDVDMFTALEFADEKERHSVNTPILPQLFHLLRESLLNHRWSEALEVMKAVLNIPPGSTQTIWKVGTELLSIEGEENRDLMQQLFNLMKVVTELNSKEVVMEFVTYLLGIGEDVEASAVMQEVIKRTGRRKECDHDAGYINRVHKGYLGLLWYLEWKKCKRMYEDLEKEQKATVESESLSQNPMQSEMQFVTMQIKSFSERAITCFQTLEGNEGIWDIFVTKHAELLICEDNKMAAYMLLKKYCETNAENLNAHKYLYNFCKEYYPHQDDKIETLKVIAQLSPSDDAVLELCTGFMNDGDMCTSVKYLFSLLDYSCWQMRSKPWKLLAKCLKSIYKNRPDDMKMMESCWNARKSWWPAYHFTKYEASNCRKDKTLMLNKAIVASLLIGKDNEFVVEAMQHLTDKEIESIP